MLILAVVELGYFLILYLMLSPESKDCAGCGSFAWNYYPIYEKGIVPAFGIAELISSTGGDVVDRKFPFLYLVTALCMDYILLFFISPRLTKFFKPK